MSFPRRRESPYFLFCPRRAGGHLLSRQKMPGKTGNGASLKTPLAVGRIVFCPHCATGSGSSPSLRSVGPLTTWPGGSKPNPAGCRAPSTNWSRPPGPLLALPRRCTSKNLLPVRHESGSLKMLLVEFQLTTVGSRLWGDPGVYAELRCWDGATRWEVNHKPPMSCGRAVPSGAQTGRPSGARMPSAQFTG